MCLETYELDPTRFLTAPVITWQGTFNKTKIRLVRLTEIGVFHAIHRYAKDNNIYLEDYDKNRRILNIGM